MNNQKDKSQGGDNRPDKSKQQSNKGSQHEAGYKPENPGTPQKGKQEQPPHPQTSPSKSSTTTRPGEKPWEPGDKPIRPVEGDDEDEKENVEELYAHGKEDKKSDKSKR